MNGERAHDVSVTVPPEPFALEPAPARRRRWAELLAQLVESSPHRKQVIVGRAPRADLLREALRRTAPRGEVRFLDVEQLDGQLVEQLRRETPDEVYFDLGADLDEQLMTHIGAHLLMDGTAVHFVFPEIGRPPVRAQASRIGSESVISLHAVSDGAAGRAVRRFIDVVGATLLLVLLAPLFATVAALVWLRMGRPIFHVQERLARGGRHFRLYKFRSMLPDAETQLHDQSEAYARYRAANFKLPAADERITPLGHLLRRTSLDELPQLWNVLRGDMSLVGPRAIVPDELAEYGDYGRMLLRVKPGLTGLWQVSGRSAIGYPERARLDLDYVEGRSLRQDLQILLRTLPAVIRQRGAL